MGSWWPTLLLVPLPLFTYILSINRIVNTWTLLAIIATYLAYLSAVKTRYTVSLSIFAGGAVYLGFIAKGPVAFFPFVVPLLGWLVLKTNFAKAASATLVTLTTFTVLLLATFHLFPDSVKFWQGFWQARVIASLTSERGYERPHWHLLQRWLSEMIVPFLVAGVFLLAFKVPFDKIRFNRPALFFLLTALAASLPFLVSTRQRGRYILHSYPLYVLCLAFVTAEIAIQIEAVIAKKKSVRIGVGVTIGIFIVAALAGMLHHKDQVARRKPFYYDIYLQKIEMPERIIVSVCPGRMIHHDWLFADMQRFYRSSLTAAMDNNYMIIVKESACTVPPGYQRINREPTRKYIVYKKKN